MKDLLRKGFLICLLVLVASVFVSCGGNKDATGGGSGNGTGGDENITYTIKYKTYIFGENVTSTELEGIISDGSYVLGTDYTKSNGVVTLTDDGFNKLLEDVGAEMNMGVVTHIVIYNNEIVFGLTDELYAYCASDDVGLTSDDFEEFEDGKIIILTTSGYEKTAILFDSGNDEGDDEAQS